VFRRFRFDSKHEQHGKRNRGGSTGREGQSCLPLSAVPTLPPDAPTIHRAGWPCADSWTVTLLPPAIARRVEASPGKWKIDKRDERGRTVDVHSLRHTFRYALECGGSCTANGTSRHAVIRRSDLTMNVYTDPKLLDVAGAMNSLPNLPLGRRQTVGKRRKCNGDR